MGLVFLHQKKIPKPTYAVKVASECMCGKLLSETTSAFSLASRMNLKTFKRKFEIILLIWEKGNLFAKQK